MPFSPGVPWIVLKQASNFKISPFFRFTEKSALLSSIFSLPELLDCYDNDILFTFRGLLNEQSGANIRNEIAHGIISEYACSTGVCLYFGVAVIKLLSLTSSSCYRILKNSEKLKHFEMLDKDAFKVVK